MEVIAAVVTAIIALVVALINLGYNIWRLEGIKGNQLDLLNLELAAAKERENLSVLYPRLVRQTEDILDWGIMGIKLTGSFYAFTIVDMGIDFESVMERNREQFREAIVSWVTEYFTAISISDMLELQGDFEGLSEQVDTIYESVTSTIGVFRREKVLGEFEEEVSEQMDIAQEAYMKMIEIIVGSTSTQMSLVQGEETNAGVQK